MSTLLPIVLGVAVVLMGIGFACGWYVRGAYTLRYMKRRLKARRQAFTAEQFAKCEAAICESLKHSVWEGSEK